jgi:hypothetical protein
VGATMYAVSFFSPLYAVSFFPGLIACIPAACYASWLRNEFRAENGLDHNNKRSFGRWPLNCFSAFTSVKDTLCMGSGLFQCCMAYQTMMEKRASEQPRARDSSLGLACSLHQPALNSDRHDGVEMRALICGSPR